MKRQGPGPLPLQDSRSINEVEKISGKLIFMIDRKQNFDNIIKLLENNGISFDALYYLLKNIDLHQSMELPENNLNDIFFIEIDKQDEIVSQYINDIESLDDGLFIIKYFKLNDDVFNAIIVRALEMSTDDDDIVEFKDSLNKIIMEQDEECDDGEHRKIYKKTKILLNKYIQKNSFNIRIEHLYSIAINACRNNDIETFVQAVSDISRRKNDENTIYILEMLYQQVLRSRNNHFINFMEDMVENLI